jgi:hypothetical protein
VCGLAAALNASVVVQSSNRETSRATAVARQVLEQMRAMSLSEVFYTFNADQSDDPEGPGTAFGNDFSLLDFGSEIGLDSLQIQVDFPTLSGGSELREDVDDPEFGMPKDLNLDGKVDSADHSADYQQLPVRVRVAWKGSTGPRQFEVATVLMRGAENEVARE